MLIHPSLQQASMKRIKREILDLSKDSADMGEIVLKPSERSIYEWKATIPGPSGSPYAGGLFDLVIQLPNDYRASSSR
jgi:ubiquitin-protein ligase